MERKRELELMFKGLQKEKKTLIDNANAAVEVLDAEINAVVEEFDKLNEQRAEDEVVQETKPAPKAPVKRTSVKKDK